MKKKRILIAEDISNVSIDIRNLLQTWGYEVHKIVGTTDAVLQELEQSTPDLVLMDIDMAGTISGMEAAIMVWDLHGIPVVYMSENLPADLIRDIAQSEAYGVVMKPYRPETLHAAIEIAFNKHQGPGKPAPVHSGCLFVRADYRYHRIDFEKIIYIEALKDYVVIHTSEGAITTHTTIKGIEEFLPEVDFARIHRSFIVRINKIQSIRYPDLIVEGKMKVLPIGGLYKKRLFERINTLQQS